MFVLIDKNFRTPLTIKVDEIIPHPVRVWMTSASATKHLRKKRLSDVDFQLVELTDSVVSDLAAMLNCRQNEIRFCESRAESWLSVAIRWYGGAILSFFAFVPAYVFVGVARSLIMGKASFDWKAVAALGVMAALFYFLALLAFRAFTGKGRKRDGGLLPPWAMKALIHAFGIMAVGIIVMGIYERDPMPIAGGGLYVFWASKALSRYVKPDKA